MMQTAFVKLANLAVLGALVCVLSAQSSTALGTSHSHHLGRRMFNHNMHAAANLKRDSKKCKQRPSSYVAPAPTSKAQEAAPATTWSSSSSAHSPSNTGSSSSGGGGGGLWGKSKLGAAFPDGDVPYISSLSGIPWIYTWTTDCPSTAVNQGMICLPQLWGWKSVNGFAAAAASHNAPVFLTINEPNEPGQANMDVGSGIALWKQSVISVRNSGKAVCSPATSSNPNGMDWVKQFKQDCPECDWDYTCVHWYDTTFEKFKDYVNLWQSTFGKPVIVSEFAPQNFNGGAQPNMGEVYNFYGQAIPWLESNNDVKAYFPFGFMKPATGINPNDDLLTSSGSLTDLGYFIKNKAGL